MAHRTRLVVGGNLFRIALEELGDATQWNRIAALNGLWDPELSLPPGQTLTLKIPARSRQISGGLLGSG